MGPIRVVLGDYHHFHLRGMEWYFTKLGASEFPGGCEVVGTAGNGHDLVELVAKHFPHLVLLDISMPGVNGFEAVRQVRAMNQEVKIIFLTTHDDPAYVAWGFTAGANGFVLKECEPQEVFRAIRQVLSGKNYVTPLVLRRKRTEDDSECALFECRPGPPLTRRQEQVLTLLASGKTVVEVAHALAISPKTVEYHRAAIMKRYRIKGTWQLAKFAVLRGLDKPAAMTPENLLRSVG